MKFKIKQLGLALLLMLVTATLVMAAPSKGNVEPKALFDSKMYFEPYSVGVYQKTIAYGETYNKAAVLRYTCGILHF